MNFNELTCSLLSDAAVEAISLLNLNVSPYTGEIFHETPLFLYFYKYLNELTPILVSLVFILCDYLTGALLGFVASNQLQHLRDLEKPRTAEFKDREDRKQLEVNEEQIDGVAFKVFTFYLLCPYSILACVGHSTGVFANLLIASSLLFATLNRRFLASIFVSLLAFNSFHSLILVLPLALIIELRRNFSCDGCKFDKFNFEFKLKREIDAPAGQSSTGKSKSVKNIVFSVYSILGTSLFCLFCMVTFSFASFLLMNRSLDYIGSTFFFM